MIRVQRFDISRMDKLNVTPEGYLEASMRAARTGILVYKDANGNPFRELCLPDELFKDQSTESIKMKPVTNDHPFVLLNSENAREFQIGFTGENVSRDGKFLKIDRVVITDKDAIADVERGKQEVSCGYELELDMQGGFWDDVNEEVNQEGRGEKFDAIQRNRKYNHVALVNKGRAGSQVRLRLDGDLNLIEEENQMSKIKIGNKEFEVAQDVAAAFEAFIVQTNADHEKVAGELNEMKKKNADDKDAQIDALTKENEKLKGNNDALKAQLDEATDLKKLQERADERMSIISTAQAIMDADDEQVEKFKKMDDAEIKKTVVAAKLKDISLDGKNDDYVSGLFETLAHTQNKDAGDDDDGLGKKIVGDRKDRAGDDEKAEKARTERLNKDANAWQKPVGPLAPVQGQGK